MLNPDQPCHSNRTWQLNAAASYNTQPWIADGDGFRDSLDANHRKTCEIHRVYTVPRGGPVNHVMFRNKNAAASHLMLQDNLYPNGAALYPYTVINVIFFRRQHRQTFSLKVFLLCTVTFIDVYLRINMATVEVQPEKRNEQGPFLCFCDVFKARERHHLDVVDWFPHHSLIIPATCFPYFYILYGPMRMFNQS